MGTNYYLHEAVGEVCPHCGRGDPADGEPLHIGKSSAGWCFSLHSIPEESLTTLAAWEERWNRPGSTIKNEYGERLTPAEMLGRIRSRSFGNGVDHPDCAEGDKGPNGLLRHRGSVPGEGTWDMCAWEFC